MTTQFQEIPAQEILGGRWSRAELETLARQTDEVPLLFDGRPSGLARRVRRVGAKLYADLCGVPRAIAEQIRRKQWKRVGCGVSHDVERDIPDVERGIHQVLFETAATQAYSRGTAEAVKVYTFDVDELSRRGQEDTMRTAKGWDGQLATVDDEVLRRMRVYRIEHPDRTVEQARDAILAGDGRLRQAYVDSKYFAEVTVGPGANVPPQSKTVTVTPGTNRPAEPKPDYITPSQGGAALVDPLVDKKAAEAELTRMARDFMAKDPSLSFEAAFRIATRKDSRLTMRYLGYT